MNKVYTLPNLLSAPTSDLQLLVRRLIEEADWSVLPALYDCLLGEDRVRDVRQLSRMITRHLCPAPNRLIYDYAEWCADLLGMFWLDLFDPAATAQAMATKPFRDDRPKEYRSVGMAPAEKKAGLPTDADRIRLLERTAQQRVRPEDIL